MSWRIRLWPAAAKLRTDELEDGEEIVASFSAGCNGIATLMDEGSVFITNRRLVWLGDQFVVGRGPRVEIRHTDIKGCSLRRASSPWKRTELSVTLRGFKQYSFHAGSRRHVQLSETLSAFPVHGLLRDGDLTSEMFSTMKAVIEAEVAAQDRPNSEVPLFLEKT